MAKEKLQGKILFIEDDKFIADLLIKYLRGKEVEIDLAIDGETGLEKARRGGYTLILLDLVLPGVSGYDILKQLKQEPTTKDIPVIILSNLGQPQEIERGLELGAEAFLVKAQLDMEEILNKLINIQQKPQ